MSKRYRQTAPIATTDADERNEMPVGGQAACRALRVLQILNERSGPSDLVPYDEIVSELTEPSIDGVPAIPTERRSLFTAMSSLRAVGIDVIGIPREGYGLARHAFSDEQATQLASLIQRADDLGSRKREALLASLMHCISPSARNAIETERNARKTPAPDSPVPEQRLQMMDARSLIERAIRDELVITYEVKEPEPAVSFLNPHSRRPQMLKPVQLIDRYGSTFVSGTIVTAHKGEPCSKTVMLSRLRSLVALEENGTLLIGDLANDAGGQV